MKSGLNTKVDKLKHVLKSVEALLKKDVLVGIPGSKTSRKNGPVNNATLGYIHDKGAPAANIPARPFMEPGIYAVKSEVAARFRAAGKAALINDGKAVEQQLNAAGLIAQASMRDVINAGVPPELKPSTIAARLRRGRTGTVPLIDTGQLRNSINYVIREK